jgi:alpha-ribazole phosphatase/probable phosphoglycerate mutase
MKTTVVDLIRHGEPVGGKIYRGHLDHPLTEKGWQQMETAVGDYAAWQGIVTSPLIRCSDFAQQLAQRLDLPLKQQADFMEVGFGQWEGQSAEQLEAENKTEFYAFYDDPINNTPPDGEPLMQFQQRILSAWDDVLQQYQGKHILIIGHAGMMRVILSHVLHMPIEAMYRIHVPNAGISRISVSGSGARAYPQLLFHAGSL